MTQSEERAAALDKHLQSLQHNLDSERHSNAMLTEENKALRNTHTMTIEAGREKVGSLEISLRSAEHALRTTQQRSADADAQRVTLQGEHDALRRRTVAAEQSVASMASEARQLRASQADLETRLRTAEAALAASREEVSNATQLLEDARRDKAKRDAQDAATTIGLGRAVSAGAALSGGTLATGVMLQPSSDGWNVVETPTADVGAVIGTGTAIDANTEMIQAILQDLQARMKGDLARDQL